MEGADGRVPAGPGADAPGLGEPAAGTVEAGSDRVGLRLEGGPRPGGARTIASPAKLADPYQAVGETWREPPLLPATGEPVSPISSPPEAVRRDSGPHPPALADGHNAALREARIIAVANQKGGVGKSTTAVNVGAWLAEADQRVLVVDLDPQGNASTGLGVDHRIRGLTTYQVLLGSADVREAIVQTPVEGLWALAATIDLAGAEIELVSQLSRESRLARALGAVRGAFDFILLDCPPSLGLLTVNALTAADELIVPIQCEYYALEGLGQLLKNVRLVQQNVNPRLRLTGIVMTMFDARTKLAEQVVAEVRSYFGPRVYDAVIPRSIRLAEAPGFGTPITLYDRTSKGADAYRRLAQEVLVRPPDGLPGEVDVDAFVRSGEEREPKSSGGETGEGVLTPQDLTDSASESLDPADGGERQGRRPRMFGRRKGGRS